MKVGNKIWTKVVVIYVDLFTYFLVTYDDYPPCSILLPILKFYHTIQKFKNINRAIYVSNSGVLLRAGINRAQPLQSFLQKGFGCFDVQGTPIQIYFFQKILLTEISKYWKHISPCSYFGIFEWCATGLLQERGSVTRFWTRLMDQSVCWHCFCCHRHQK